MIAHIRRATSVIALGIATVVGGDMAAAQPRTTDFAALDRCPISDLDLAAMELVASGAAGTTRLSGDTNATVSYMPRQDTLIFRPGDGGTEGALEIEVPDGPLATWAVRVQGRDGETLSAVLAPELDFADLTMDSQDSAEPRGSGESALFSRILAPEETPIEVLEVLRSLNFTAVPIGPGCGPSAAWCAKYASRVVGPAVLCAASFGADGGSCEEARVAHCAWCECKGYDCKKC